MTLVVALLSSHRLPLPPPPPPPAPPTGGGVPHRRGNRTQQAKLTASSEFTCCTPMHGDAPERERDRQRRTIGQGPARDDWDDLHVKAPMMPVLLAVCSVCAQHKGRREATPDERDWPPPVAGPPLSLSLDLPSMGSGAANFASSVGGSSSQRHWIVTLERRACCARCPSLLLRTRRVPPSAPATGWEISQEGRVQANSSEG